MTNDPGWDAPQEPSKQQPSQQPPPGQQPNWNAQPPPYGGPPPQPQPGQYPPGQQYPYNQPGPYDQGGYGQGGYGQAPAQSGLAPNIAAMLSYLLFGWIGGLIMYFSQKDREVRFHAAQSILTFGGLAVISIVLNVLNAGIGSALIGLIGLLLSLTGFVLWIFLSIQGYQLKHTKLPIVGDIAEQWAVK